MSGLKEYRVPAPGGEITVQLSDDDAARYGDKAELVVKAKAPANKSKAPANKSADA